MQKLVGADSSSGGRAYLEGTTSNAGLADTPVRRRVQLIAQDTAAAGLSLPGRVVREGWSDAVTGEWRFDFITAGRRYSVIAYDHTGQHDPVIKSGLLPTPMDI